MMISSTGLHEKKTEGQASAFTGTENHFIFFSMRFSAVAKNGNAAETTDHNNPGKEMKIMPERPDGQEGDNDTQQIIQHLFILLYRGTGPISPSLYPGKRKSQQKRK